MISFFFIFHSFTTDFRHFLYIFTSFCRSSISSVDEFLLEAVKVPRLLEKLESFLSTFQFEEFVRDIQTDLSKLERVVNEVNVKDH